MFTHTQDMLELLISGSVFGLVLALWALGVTLWALRRASRSRRVGERLGHAEPTTAEKRVLSLWHEGREATTSVPGRAHLGLWGRLDQLLRDAGWDTQDRVLLVVIFVVMTIVSVAATRVFLGSALSGAGIAVAVIWVFVIYLRRRTTHRAALFERQFVDALELAARSLRAGHPLAGTFRLVADEIRPPVGSLFAEICQHQELGVAMEDALRRVAATSTSSDLKLFVTSVIIQLRTGGNLADMMDRVAYVIRDRMRLSRRIRVLTAQTQFSKRILIGLPFIVFIVLNIINPHYMEPFYSTSVGKLLLVVAASTLVLGAWTMNRLAVLRY